MAAVGTAVAAAYLLRALRLVWHGPVPGPRPGEAVRDVEPPRTMGDVTAHELSVTGPLVLAVGVLGVLPWVLLDVTGPAVRSLLGGLLAAAGSGLGGSP